MQHLRRWATLAIIGVLVAGLAACGVSDSTSDSGESGDGDNGGGNCPEPSFDDLTGLWTVRNELTGDCMGTVDVFTVHITQTDAELRIIGKTSFTATLCGSRATADRDISYVRNSGVETITNLTLQFSSTTDFTGTAQWRWEGDSSTCSGDLTITGGR